MKVNTKEFLKEMEFALRFAEKKSTIPVLRHALLTASATKLTIVSTDLEVAGVTSVDGAMEADEAPWSTTAPVPALVKYLAQIQDDTLDIRPKITVIPEEKSMKMEWDPAKKANVEREVVIPERQAHKIVITHGGDAEWGTDGLDPSTFPEIPMPTELCAVIHNIKTVQKRAAIAITAEESRFTLNGALLELNAERPSVVVATDGHRLSWQTIDATITAPVQKSIIPKKALYEASRMNGDTVGFGRNDDYGVFTCGRRAVITRLLKGNFPDYERVIPKEYWRTMNLDSETLMAVCKRVALVADERSKAAAFQIEGERLAVWAKSERGEGKGSVDTQWPDAAEFKVGLNITYVIDFLGLAPGIVSMDVPAVSGKTGTFTDAQTFRTADGTWKYVVMPMRM